jgi:hypothetical protein
LIAEARRRAYLAAMQVTSWLPRVELPFAAPSRSSPPPPDGCEVPVDPPMVERALPAAGDIAPVPAPVMPVTPVDAPVAKEPVPRFALQLYRSGPCLLLVELPSGDAMQSRDPAYLLLKDLLRAAGLPESPTPLGDPVRWPMLLRGNFAQGPQAAREYVQGVVMSRIEELQQPPACIWLVGLPALRFLAEVEADSYEQELLVAGIGTVWAMPGLELLMDEPERKRPLWQAMQRVRGRWLDCVGPD